MRRFLTAAAFALMASACATAGANNEEEGEGAYIVIDPEATIFPASAVNGFEAVDEDTLLLRVGASRKYLADIWRPCTRDLRFVQAIGISNRRSPTVDNFAEVVVDGRTCPISNLRQVERKPEPTEPTEQATPAGD